MRKRKFIRYRLLPVVFILMLVFPFINKSVTIIESAKSTEKRALATKPKFDINNLDPFPGKYEDYYNDNFNLRSNFTRLYNYIKFEYLNINPNPDKVIIGKDGWMFWNTKMVPSNWKNNLLSKHDLEIIKDELLSREAFLEAHNCKLYIAVIPSKHSIYYDKFKDPPEVNADTTIISVGDQFVHYMDSATNLNVINLRTNLLKNKNKYQLFHKYDHHWNNLGGFLASKVILDTIQKKFPNINMTIDLNDFDITYLSESGGDLAQMIGLKDKVFEEHPQLTIKDNEKAIQGIKDKRYQIPKGFDYGWGYEVRRTSNNDLLPNCMIIRDSNGSFVKNFLSYGFNNSFYLWDEWKYQINKDIFLQEKPDVFIIMIPENSLEMLKDKWK